MASGAGVGIGPSVRVAVRTAVAVRGGTVADGGACRAAESDAVVALAVAVRVAVEPTRVLVTLVDGVLPGGVVVTVRLASLPATAGVLGAVAVAVAAAV